MASLKTTKVDYLRFFRSANAVLFDLDGVVIDSDSLHDEAKKAALDYYGFKIADSDWKEIKNHSISQIYEWLYLRNPEIGVTEKDLVAHKRNYFSQFAESKIDLVPNVLLFINFLKKQGIRTALVTATGQTAFEFFRRKFELDKYFEVFVTGDDVKNLKPHPEAYLKAVSLLGLETENCVVIEDTPIGVQSGKTAGCFVVGKESTVAKDVLLAKGADVVFRDFDDLNIE